MPRPGPTDVIPALLTPGEAVLAPEVAEAVGRENIKAANDRAVSKRKGIIPLEGYGCGASKVQGFATGTEDVAGQYPNPLSAQTTAPMTTATTGGKPIYQTGNSFSDKPNTVNRSTGITTVGGGTTGQSIANQFTKIAPPMVGMPGVASGPANNDLAKQNLFARTKLDTAARLGKAGNMDAATGIMQDLNKAKPTPAVNSAVAPIADLDFDSKFTASAFDNNPQGYAEGAEDVDFQPLSEKEKQGIVSHPLVAGSQNAARRISEGYSNSGSGIVPTTKGIIAGAARAVSDPWKAKLGLPDSPPTEPAVEQPKRGFMDTLSDIARKNAQVTAAIPGAVKSAGEKEMGAISNIATAVTRPQWGINPAPKVAEPATQTAFQQEMAGLTSGPSADLAREKALQSKGGVQIKTKPTPTPEAQTEQTFAPKATDSGQYRVDLDDQGQFVQSANKAGMDRVAKGLRARGGIVKAAQKPAGAVSDFWINRGYPGGAEQYKAEQEQKALQDIALYGGGRGNMEVSEYRRANAQQKAAQGILADRERINAQKEQLAAENKKSEASMAATGAEREYQHRKDLKEAEQKQAEMEQRERLAGEKPVKIGEDIMPTRDVPAYQARKAHEAKVATLADFVKNNSGLFSGSAEDALVEGLIQQGDQEGAELAELKAYLNVAKPEQKKQIEAELRKRTAPYRSALNG